MVRIAAHLDRYTVAYGDYPTTAVRTVQGTGAENMLGRGRIPGEVRSGLSVLWHTPTIKVIQIRGLFGFPCRETPLQSGQVCATLAGARLVLAVAET
jgi:hypothetical protein